MCLLLFILFNKDVHNDGLKGAVYVLFYAIIAFQVPSCEAGKTPILYQRVHIAENYCLDKRKFGSRM